MIDRILIVGYLVVLLIIGYFSGRKLKTPREFALSDRRFNLLTMVATTFASFLGGAVLFGVPERVYKVGIIFLICFFGNAVNMLLVAYTMVDPVAKYKDAMTLGDIAYDMYGKFGRILVGVCTVILSAGVVGTQMGVIGAVGRDFLQIDSELAIKIGCVVFIAYSGFGGIKAVALTDVFQFFVFAVILPIIVSIVLQNTNGVEGLWNALPDTHKTLCRADWGSYLMLMLWYCCPVFDPPFMQRILVMGERGRVITKKAFVIVAFLVIIYAIFLGILGGCAALIPNIEPEKAFWTVVNTTLPPGLKGLVGIGILAITMSLADSDLNVGSISFARDIIKTFYPQMSEKMELWLMRWSTLLFGIAAYYIAISFNDLLDIVFYFSNFWMPLIVVPMYFGFYGLKVSSRMFMIVSVLTSFATWYWIKYMPNELVVESSMAGMLVNLILMSLGYFYEKKYGVIFSKKQKQICKE